MIRVIHYMPDINYTNGIAQLVMNYYRKINREHIQFHFIYFSKTKSKNFRKEIISLGGTEEFICAPTKYIKYQKELNRFLKSFKEKYKNDEIIFHNHQLAFTIFQYFILKKNNIMNMVVHNHMTKFSDNKLKALRNMILFLPVSFLKVKYFACSKDACNLISKYNFTNKQNIYVLKNGIDCNKFKFNIASRNKIRKQLKISTEFVFGNIGRFERVKNQAFLIRLFSRKYNSDNYKLLLVGDGSRKNNIINMVKKYNLENRVLFLENRDDIPSILCAMDCFLFPSKFEGLGISAIEAQASGLPIIISKYVPSEVIITNRIKQLTYNINSWIGTIEKFKSQNINRSSINKIVAKTEYNINKNVIDLEKEYEKIVGR